eukprot:5659969-Heterocapsa_arctica.AAC.1
MLAHPMQPMEEKYAIVCGQMEENVIRCSRVVGLFLHISGFLVEALMVFMSLLIKPQSAISV